ncbi:SDR family oxidoreductase [Chryseolinea sp. H1M3-3]|uniref:SDR family oxidoreductase n=1 Tax=Chryseolinea sp. H1M3-3 TaxID=3034144 RepID=UPI0023ED6B41|nr:SDR family oxidoreductase [Chryseolinea sp. H1M3-3]
MNKIILITGGSQGIGAATARLAAKRNYTVCINYHKNDDAANSVVKEIENDGGHAFAFKADISKEAEVLRLFKQIDHQIGRISGLVNNAGIILQQERFINMTEERLQKTFATNVFGSFLCAREAIKRMSTKLGGAGGSIVNLSSIAARLGAPFEYIDYAAAKGAIDTMTIGLAKEIADENIRVNVVRPGLIHTDIHAKAGEPGRIERVKSLIPLKRGGQPEEVANMILWLLSDEASYVTGSIFDVTGGR